MIVTGIIAFAVAQLAHLLALTGVQTLFTNGTLPTPADKFIPYVNAAIVGLLAALIEEGIRWIAFRVTLKYAKPFRSSVGFGVGFGGSELLIVGFLVAYNLGTVLFYNPGHQIAKGVSAATVQTVLEQIAAYWQSTWYISLMSIFEKLVEFSSQMVFSIFVWKSVKRDQPVWFLTAILYHIVISGITTLLSGLSWNFWEIEGILALFLLLNIYLLYTSWGEEGGLDSEGDDDEEEDEDEDEGDEDVEEDDEDDEEDEEEEEEAEK
jgi:uncharacterized membrane protein YhfC